jgi:hypothetical protein
MGQEGFISNTVKVNSIKLTSYKGREIDITNMVREINIYESIYSNGIDGSIDIIDSREMIQFLPIIGEETLEVDIILPGTDSSSNFIFKDFRIFRITDRTIKSHKVQNYKLWFSSKEKIINLEKRVCKSYKSQTSEDIVKSIFDEYLDSTKALETESTIGVHNYIATNLNPLQAINYICGFRSINNNKLSDFFFFESLDSNNKTSKYNYKSLGSLSQGAEVVEFDYKPKSGINTNNVYTYPYVITGINFSNGFDIFQSKKNGLYNQTYVYYDLLRKKYVFQKSNYDDFFNETKGKKLETNSNKMFGTNTESYGEFFDIIYSTGFPERTNSSQDFSSTSNKTAEKRKSRSTNNYINSHTGTVDTLSTLLEQTVSRRKVLVEEFETNKIILNEISGNYKYTIGNVIIFNKPNIVFDSDLVSKESGSMYDSFISGRYLITKNRHVITRSESSNWSYKNHLEISKNTFKKSLDSI